MKNLLGLCLLFVSCVAFAREETITRCYELSNSNQTWPTVKSQLIMREQEDASGKETFKQTLTLDGKAFAELSLRRVSRARCIDCNADTYAPSEQNWFKPQSPLEGMIINFDGRVDFDRNRNPRRIESGIVQIGGATYFYRDCVK